MSDLEIFKQQLIDVLADEYSYSKHYNDLTSMSTIEDVFHKLSLDKSVLEYINKD